MKEDTLYIQASISIFLRQFLSFLVLIEKDVESDCVDRLRWTATNDQLINIS